MDESDTQSDQSLVERATIAVAAELRAARARAGLQQSELARLAGMHTNTVQRLEKGERAMSIPQLYSLGAVLGFNPADFLDAAQAAMSKQATGSDA